MSILQRYVLKEMLGPLGLGMLVFTFVFLIGQIFQLTNLLLNSGVPPSLALELILSMLPNICSYTIPMAVLLAILLGVGRLAADREILAIRTSGINLIKVFIPVIVGAGLISGGMIWLNQEIVPYLNLKFEDLKTQLLFEIISAVPPDKPTELDGGKGGVASTFLYEYREPGSGHLRGVRLHTRMDQTDATEEKREDLIKDEIRSLQGKKDASSKSRLVELRARLEEFAKFRRVQEALVFAHSGRIKADLDEQMITIELTSGTINVINSADPGAHDVVKFASLSKNIFPNLKQDEDGTFKKKPRAMGVAELKQQISREEKARKRNSLVAEFWRRQSVPLACIAFTLIGIPLAVYARPTGKAVAFAISFFLILIYYALLQTGLGLGENGSEFAVLAIYFPNLLLGAVGAALMYRMVMR